MNLVCMPKLVKKSLCGGGCVVGGASVYMHCTGSLLGCKPLKEVNQAICVSACTGNCHSNQAILACSAEGVAFLALNIVETQFAFLDTLIRCNM